MPSNWMKVTGGNIAHWLVTPYTRHRAQTNVPCMGRGTFGATQMHLMQTSGTTARPLAWSSPCSTQSGVMNAYLNADSMAKTITGAPKAWTIVTRTHVTMTGTIAALMSIIPGTTISVQSDAVERAGQATTGVTKKGVAGNTALLHQYLGFI